MDDPGTLVRRWCEYGDDAAFDQFYRGQADRLWRFLVARGVHPEAAYDIVADSFERFVRRICGDPRQPVALLYRIAINRATDTWRRERVREPAPPVDADTLGDDGGDAPRLAAVDCLLAGLEESEQNLLLLRYWIGLTHREVAHALGRPEGTVRRQAAELIARLRALDAE